MICYRRGRASGCSACGPRSCWPWHRGCCCGVMCEPGTEAENGDVDGVSLPAGRPGQTSPGRPAGWRWPGVAGLLREPFRRRSWAECGYAIACLPLAVASFVFAIGTLAVGVGLTLTIVGVVIGPLLIAASSPGVRGLGSASRYLAHRLLGLRVAAPPPPHRKSGVVGWFWSAL